jgi:hypothetical protein
MIFLTLQPMYIIVDYARLVKAVWPGFNIIYNRTGTAPCIKAFVWNIGLAKNTGYTMISGRWGILRRYGQ